MSKGINKAIVLGYVGSDPAVRYSKSGSAIASFSVATSESYTERATSEKKEITDWHRIVFYGPLAERVAEYVKKGLRVYVSGKMRQRKYTDKSNAERSIMEIIGDEFQLLEYKREQSEEEQATTNNSNSYASSSLTNNLEDDDIPF